MTLETAKWIPWLPAISAVLCGLCLQRPLRKLTTWICFLSVAAGLAITVGLLQSGVVQPYQVGSGSEHVVHLFSWIHSGDFVVDFAYFIDPLTLVMLVVVTGIGSLVIWYAGGYMSGDRGYGRFFAFVSIFIFAMTTLVMADNLVLLYLGWEGVGLCSYLLIGYYYDKPSAVAAGKKAFIVNRIGDLGFALGIFLTYTTFDTVSLAQVLDKASVIDPATATTAHVWIPFLLMLGAFGKSAQIPLHVWLPDAMEGPTPVSALIHAATMVTAGVYMIVRLLPVFALSPWALPTVAVVGGVTALFAATIALCQYDLKKIYAYSTVSQLGYMFLAVGALSSVGAIFHLFTHAFFKALLFLTAGSVMHALAGQLDLRKISGLRRKMPVTATLMFVGCLALAGFPGTAGFFSKDLILAAVMEKGLNGEPLYLVLAVMGMLTALLTAFYCFRLWFRVFMGPETYEMGHEHHSSDEHAADHPHGAEEPAAAGHAPAAQVEHHHDAHEVSLLTMNAPLIVLAVGAVAVGFMFHNWMEHSVTASTAGLVALHEAPAAAGHAAEADHAAPATAAVQAAAHHGPLLLGQPVHSMMMWLSSGIAILGICLAGYYHWLNRPAADRAAAAFRAVVKLLANKYYVDELYDAAIVKPLRALGEVFYVFDTLVIDGLVNFVGLLPRVLGRWAQPGPRGYLQGYGVAMATGVALLAFLAWAMMT